MINFYVKNSKLLFMCNKHFHRNFFEGSFSCVSFVESLSACPETISSLRVILRPSLTALKTNFRQRFMESRCSLGGISPFPGFYMKPRPTIMVHYSL